MSRTDLDAVTLARSLRDMAGDGSAEWLAGPIQTSLLLDVADLLDERDRFADASKKWMGKAAHFEAENARLRSCLTDDVENERLIMAENAKLRELVRELWTYAEQELVCDKTCSYGAVCDWKDCVLTRRMRELGVEVDG